MQNEQPVEEGVKEGRFTKFLNRFFKRPDADVYFDTEIRDQLAPVIEPAHIGLYERINTYLYQYQHYVGLIDRDIKSFRFNQIVYMVLYTIFLVIASLWLIVLEYQKQQVEVSGQDFTSWGLMVVYVVIAIVGLWLLKHTYVKVKLINDSRRNLYGHADKVISSCALQNRKIFADAKNGTSAGFDDWLLKELDLQGILNQEFPTIQKSYLKYLLNNENFAYQNLPSTIRTHQALYSFQIKQYANLKSQSNIDDKSGHIEESILNLHYAKIYLLHTHYQIKLKNMKDNLKEKKVKLLKVSNVDAVECSSKC